MLYLTVKIHSDIVFTCCTFFVSLNYLTGGYAHCPIKQIDKKFEHFTDKEFSNRLNPIVACLMC